MTLYYQINYTLTEVPDGRGLFPRPVPPRQSAAVQRGLHHPGRREGPGAVRGHVPGLGRQQQRLVGRGRDQVLHGWRQGVPDHLRHGHRGLFLRLVQFRRRARRTAATGSSPRRTAGLPQVIRPDGLYQSQTAVRPVPLAHHGPDPLRAGPARDHPGAGLAQRRPLPAAAGRHRLGRILVSDPADRAVPRAAG